VLLGVLAKRGYSLLGCSAADRLLPSGTVTLWVLWGPVGKLELPQKSSGDVGTLQLCIDQCTDNVFVLVLMSTLFFLRWTGARIASSAARRALSQALRTLSGSTRTMWLCVWGVADAVLYVCQANERSLWFLFCSSGVKLGASLPVGLAINTDGLRASMGNR
jgi:hypothetical protein